MKPLLKYIVDSFWNELAKFEYLATINSLKVKYEQVLSLSLLGLFHYLLWCSTDSDFVVSGDLWSKNRSSCDRAEKENR